VNRTSKGLPDYNEIGTSPRLLTGLVDAVNRAAAVSNSLLALK